MGKGNKKIWYIGITQKGETKITTRKPGKYGRFQQSHGPYTKQELQTMRKVFLSERR